MKLPVFRDPVTDQPSFSITVAAITFSVVLIRWTLGGDTIFGHRFEPVTNEAITTWLTPTLLLYFGRKATGAASDVAIAKANQGGP